MKPRPVSVKSSDGASSSPSCDILYSELARLLRDDSVENEVVIDWIDVRLSLFLPPPPSLSP